MKSTSRKTTLLAGAAALLVLSTAACGGDDPPMSPTAPTPGGAQAPAYAGNDPKGILTTGRSPSSSGDAADGQLSGNLANGLIQNPSGPAPGPVLDFDALLDDRGRIVLTWQPPEDTSIVQGYAAFQDWSVLEDLIGPTEACDATGCRWTWGRRGNGSYNLGIAAVSRWGDGPGSREVLNVNVHTPTHVEQMAARQLGTDGSPYDATVSWRMPLRNGVVDCYVHEFEIGQGHGPATGRITVDEQTCPTASHVFSKTYTALSLGGYTFKVRARTSAGWGPWDYKTVTIARDQLLTAEWRDVPLRHDYPASFTITLQFSKAVDVTEDQLRNYAIAYDGATIASVEATTPGSTRSWAITLTPASRTAPVYAGVWQVQSWETCDQNHTICADGEALSADAMVVVAAP